MTGAQVLGGITDIDHLKERDFLRLLEDCGIVAPSTTFTHKLSSSVLDSMAAQPRTVPAPTLPPCAIPCQCSLRRSPPPVAAPPRRPVCRVPCCSD